MRLGNFLIFVFVLFSNLWILRIFRLNIFIGLLVILLTTILYFLYEKKAKFKKVILIGMLFGLLVIQYKTTFVPDLSQLDEQEKVVQRERFREYPASFLPFGHWFEDRKESIVYFKFEKNLFENLNLNLFFFGNYPRQRSGIEEFEKFPFIYLPIFLYGFYLLIKEKKFIELGFLFFIPLLFLGVIGSKSSLGPLALFPFFIWCIYLGVLQLYEKIYQYKNRKIFISIFLVLTVLILTQIYIYENL